MKTFREFLAEAAERKPKVPKTNIMDREDKAEVTEYQKPEGGFVHYIHNPVGDKVNKDGSVEKGNVTQIRQLHNRGAKEPLGAFIDGDNLTVYHPGSVRSTGEFKSIADKMGHNISNKAHHVTIHMHPNGKIRVHVHGNPDDETIRKIANHGRMNEVFGDKYEVIGVE